MEASSRQVAGPKAGLAVKAVVALTLAVAAAGLRAAPQLRLDPGSASVGVGQVFSVVLTGTSFDLTAGGELINNVTGGQNLNFAFSNATLQVLSVTIDPRWTFTVANKPGVIDPLAGTVTGTAFAAFPATTDDDFNIATFSVKALAPGAGGLALTSAQVIGQVGGTAGQLITTGFVAANVAVSAVPESQSWALLSAGLAALCGMTLKFRRR